MLTHFKDNTREMRLRDANKHIYTWGGTVYTKFTSFIWNKNRGALPCTYIVNIRNFQAIRLTEKALCWTCEEKHLSENCDIIRTMSVDFPCSEVTIQNFNTSHTLFYFKLIQNKLHLNINKSPLIYLFFRNFTGKLKYSRIWFYFL